MSDTNAKPTVADAPAANPASLAEIARVFMLGGAGIGLLLKGGVLRRVLDLVR